MFKYFKHLSTVFRMLCEAQDGAKDPRHERNGQTRPSSQCKLTFKKKCRGIQKKKKSVTLRGHSYGMHFCILKAQVVGEWNGEKKKKKNKVFSKVKLLTGALQF